MSTSQYRCRVELRRRDVEASTLNGIDFLEVLPGQTSLAVSFLKPLTPNALDRDNVVIEGGVRIRGVKVLTASPSGNVLTVAVDLPGDFSTYRLRLRRSPSNDAPPSGFDSQLCEVAFSFKAGCPNEFDCRVDLECPQEALEEPEIDYLAKDYASFRRLMLDRLAALVPDWRERNPADAHVALVELLAYIGDHLSYFQDAVATEAYLGTARKRVSLRRHARLLDYAVHAGCNARAWIVFDVTSTIPLPAGTRLLTGGRPAEGTVEPGRLEQALAEGPLVFETVAAASLRAARSTIRFHTWSDSDCCLPRGATRATLHNDPATQLTAGDVVLFEEVVEPGDGSAKAAPDPARTHVVRLTAARATTDPVTASSVLEIEWDGADALPFPLCISTLVRNPDGTERAVADVSVARGNVVLVDHGLSLPLRAGDPPEPLVPPRVPEDRRYRPRLAQRPVTFRADPDLAGPAVGALRHDPRSALPVVELVGDGRRWKPQHHLLGGDSFDDLFVVELESDDVAEIRFGDGERGRAPRANASFAAAYRLGNGSGGNVGAGAIHRVVLSGGGVRRVWNPLPATGGVDPEPLEQVRVSAPEAFRIQERAVTEADYAAVAERSPDVQRAAGRFRWTGSWYTAFVTADRVGGAPVDPAFETRMSRFLDRFRMAGHDLELDAPVMVPLQLALDVCVAPGYFRSNVKQALLHELGSRTLPDGRRGAFHPDEFTFGQPVYLSQIYARALEVSGVRWARATTFQRFGKAPNGELEREVLEPAPTEIVRLDNDPNFPENGRLDLALSGGL